jgi:lipopolysaccharide/colanic/teichoic acid biosynthesis glycosyltransferase
MIKRIFDISVSFIGLLALSPILLPVIFLVWNQDKSSPFYIAPRVGEGEKLFNMFKLRSMVIDADKTGVDSTSSNDNRITPIGHVIRKYKLDELTQLWNVLIGDMSLVGPRPNVRTETDLYSSVERGLLAIRPGVTDFSSIVFSDEGEILENEEDPDLAYNQLIRPWKSRLGLIYIEHKTFFLDLKLIFYTAIAIVSREKAIQLVVRELISLDVESSVVQVAHRSEPLLPHPPPGMNKVVSSR